MVIRIRLISSMENVAPLSAGRESIFSIRLPTSLQSVPMARLLLHHTSQCILHSRRNVIIPGNLLKQQLPCRPKIPAQQLFFILYVSKVYLKTKKMTDISQTQAEFKAKSRRNPLWIPRLFNAKFRCVCRNRRYFRLFRYPLIY